MGLISPTLTSSPSTLIFFILFLTTDFKRNWLQVLFCESRCLSHHVPLVQCSTRTSPLMPLSRRGNGAVSHAYVYSVVEREKVLKQQVHSLNSSESLCSSVRCIAVLRRGNCSSTSQQIFCCHIIFRSICTGQYVCTMYCTLQQYSPVYCMLVHNYCTQ